MDPSGTDTMTRGAPPGGGVRSRATTGWRSEEEKRLADRILLDDALEAMVAENRSRAMRLDAVSEFHARRVAEVEARGSGAPGFFVLTSLQATKVEFCPLLGIGELMLQFDLELTDGLKQWFPRLWRRCMKGRLDIGRARLAYDQLLNLTNDADKAAFAELHRGDVRPDGRSCLAALPGEPHDVAARDPPQVLEVPAEEQTTTSARRSRSGGWSSRPTRTAWEA